jgi:K+:H+ antiporter subunit KhtU
MILAASGDPATLFLELGTAILVLALAARLAAKTGFSSVPLYLVAGLLIGATSRPSWSDEFISTTAEIGVVLVLFTLGLEYTALELAVGLRTNVRHGLLDFALNFPPGFAAGLLLGWGMLGALVLGGVTYVSSSGIAAKALADLGRVGNRETPVLLSLLVFEDLAMAVYLPLAGVLLLGGGWLTAVASVAVALVVVGAVFFVALRHGHVVSRAVWHESDEALLLTTVGLLLVVAGISERAHVSAAIGAFLLGIALSGPAAERARTVITPLRDVFAATFFLFFALRLQLGEVPSVLAPALALVALTCVAKPVPGWFAAAAAGIEAPGRLRAGTALIAHGEFSIVIAGLGVGAGLEPSIGTLAATYVLATAFLGPLATKYADVLTLGPRVSFRRARAT